MENKKQNNLEQIKSGVCGLWNEIVGAVESKFVALARMRLRRGLRHENHKYSGKIDAFVGGFQMKYGLGDILRGTIQEPVRVQNHVIGYKTVRVEIPTSYYAVGRYMALAESLLKFGINTEDVDTALQGYRVYRWLGQGQRKSVKNKLQRVYDNAKEISAKYNVPLSVSNDSSRVVMSHESRREIERILEVSKI